MSSENEKKRSDYRKDGHERTVKKVNSAVVIPALNPMQNFVAFVRELLACGVPQVIVVNDGSDCSFHDIFREVGNLDHCTVLSHKVNRGKGRALKTGFTYVMEHFPYLDGVVTADADGQHSIEDIYKLCEELSLHQNSLILGVRDFKKMPKRSYLGNLLSSYIFRLIYNSKLNDTQTGLRGIPRSELGWMIETKGERYDYEINMLIKAKFRNVNFIMIPIMTLYFDNNSSSHYSAIRDSMLIFFRLISGLIRYSGLTIIAGIIDVLIFFLLNSLVLADWSAPVRIFFSTIIARITSSLFNYWINRRVLFTNTIKSAYSVIRYYVLLTGIVMASYVLVYTISLFWTINESVIKLIVDIGLGFISYQVQLRWVFPKKEDIRPLQS